MKNTLFTGECMLIHFFGRLKDYEVSFLRLIEKITNGTSIVINETGTSVLVRPGTIPGGKYTHTCPTSRSIGYFLEAVVPLGIFGKVGLEIKFDGITGEEGRDMTVSPQRSHAGDCRLPL